ncbi:MAG: pilus assembly protein PilM, partial [Chromatiales bacterium]|nr:pilus assembly protein PilM [Chromatiales bacterium]
MVTSALAWWIRQLRGKQVHRGPTIRVRSTADGVVTVHQGGRTKLMAALDPGNLAAENPLGLKKLKPSRTRVVMPVDAASVLDWPITLPAAASENLRQVVYLQLDQVTPFAAESVVFSFDVVEGVTADHSMQVGLRVAPRRLVEVQRKALEAAGFSLPWEWASVEREGDEFVIAFTPPVVGRSLVFYGAVWAINVCLLAALVAWPFWEQQRALDALQRALIDARPRAEAAAAFRDRKDGLVEQT